MQKPADAINGWFARLPTYWKLATVRCVIYAAMCGWGAFLAGVEGYDYFSQMSEMVKIKLAGSIVLSMAGAWLAFLDNTLAQFKHGDPQKPNETKDKNETQT